MNEILSKRMEVVTKKELLNPALTMSSAYSEQYQEMLKLLQIYTMSTKL